MLHVPGTMTSYRPQGNLGPAVDRPAYTAGEAARYARTSPSTTRRWIRGYSYSTVRGPHQARPVVGGPSERLLTFHDLVEVAAIASAINAGVRLQRIRVAIDYARERFDVARPLLLERFLTDGRDLYLHEVDDLAAGARDLHVNASASGQIAFGYIADVLRDLDYQDGQPTRWWPIGKDGPILVDPKIGFGQPVIFESGVRTETLADRWLAGESLEEVAEEFDLAPAVVEAALRFENRLGLIPA